MKYIVILILMFAVSPAVSFAQENQRTQANADDSLSSWEFVKERIFFGGTGGASFGSFTFVNLSPLVGIRLKPHFATGVGGTYVFINDKYFDYKTSIYGGRVFARYYFLKNYIAHGEYELLNAERWNEDERSFERVWTPALPLGGGIRQSMGRRGHIEVLLLMDLLYKPSTSVYASPIRLNFGFIF